MDSTFLDFDLFPVPERAQPQNNIKGAGEKGIWIWYEAGEAQQPEMESFLAKVFGAARIDLAQHANYICLTTNETISFSQVGDSNNAKFVFLFGISGKRLGLHFRLPPYQPVNFGLTTYISADDIREIFEERQAGKKEKSGKLWRALRTCFDV